MCLESRGNARFCMKMDLPRRRRQKSQVTEGPKSASSARWLYTPGIQTDPPPPPIPPFSLVHRWRRRQWHRSAQEKMDPQRPTHRVTPKIVCFSSFCRLLVQQCHYCSLAGRGVPRGPVAGLLEECWLKLSNVLPGRCPDGRPTTKRSLPARRGALSMFYKRHFKGLVEFLKTSRGTH